MRERLISLLNILSNSKSEKITHIANELGVTTKTIRNEIKEINELLASNNLPIFLVERGTIINNLSVTQNSKLISRFGFNAWDEFYLSPQQRLIYLLLEFLTTKNPVFIVSMQDKLQVSKSTMDNDMCDLRRLVQPYGLRITTDLKQGVSVIGNERAIRSMFVDVLTREPSILKMFTKSPETQNPLVKKIRSTMSFDDVQFVQRLLTDIFAGSPLAENENYWQQAILMTLIWVTRVRSGHFVDTNSDVKNISVTSKQSNFANAIIEHFKLSLNVTAESEYLGFTIGSFDSNSENELNGWAMSQVITSSLIDWMESKLGFPFSKSESLFERVYKHISALLRRVDQKLSVYNPLERTIEQSYPEIFNAVASFFENKIKDHHMKLSNDEIGYLAVYFSTAQAEIQKNHVYLYRVAVVCNYGLATGRLLATKLEEHFNVDVIAVLSATEVGILHKLPVSLVFKTVNIPIESLPSIKLNPIPTEEDIKIAGKFLDQHTELSKYEGNILEPTNLFNNILDGLKENDIKVGKELVFNLQRVFEANRLEINERKVQPMLKDLVTDNQIQLQVTAKDWVDAIKISAQPLLHQGYINNSYVQAMIESVNKFGPYIVIGPSIALAHARPEDGANKLGVSITTLKEPINFGNPQNDPVKIIFCLAAIDNYSHLNVIKEIVQLINNQKNVEHLVKISSLSEFKKTLFDTFLTKESI